MVFHLQELDVENHSVKVCSQMQKKVCDPPGTSKETCLKQVTIFQLFSSYEDLKKFGAYHLTNLEVEFGSYNCKLI